MDNTCKYGYSSGDKGRKDMITKNDIKFVKYEPGHFYCNGKLTLKIVGLEYTFAHYPYGELPQFWETGGNWDFDGNYKTNPWKVNSEYTDEIIEELNEEFGKININDLLEIMNEHVKWGCCGHCARYYSDKH